MHIFRRINAEVLARPVLDFYELTEEEEVGLEEELLYTERMGDIDEFEGMKADSRLNEVGYGDV